MIFKKHKDLRLIILLILIIGLILAFVAPNLIKKESPVPMAGYPSPTPAQFESESKLEVTQISKFGTSNLWWNDKNELYFYEYPEIKKFKVGKVEKVLNLEDNILSINYHSNKTTKIDSLILYVGLCIDGFGPECSKFSVINLTSGEENVLSGYPDAIDVSENGNIMGVWGDYTSSISDGGFTRGFREYSASEGIFSYPHVDSFNLLADKHHFRVSKDGSCFATEFSEKENKVKGIGIWCRKDTGSFELVEKIEAGKPDEMFFIESQTKGLVYLDKENNLNVVWNKSSNNWINEKVLADLKGNNLQVNIDLIPHTNKVVYTVFEPNRGGTSYWSVNLETKENTRLVDSEIEGGQVEDFKVSPDGKKIAFIRLFVTPRPGNGELNILGLD